MFVSIITEEPAVRNSSASVKRTAYPALNALPASSAVPREFRIVPPITSELSRGIVSSRASRVASTLFPVPATPPMTSRIILLLPATRKGGVDPVEDGRHDAFDERRGTVAGAMVE